MTIVKKLQEKAITAGGSLQYRWVNWRLKRMEARGYRGGKTTGQIRLGRSCRMTAEQLRHLNYDFSRFALCVVAAKSFTGDCFYMEYSRLTYYPYSH